MTLPVGCSLHQHPYGTRNKLKGKYRHLVEKVLSFNIDITESDVKPFGHSHFAARVSFSFKVSSWAISLRTTEFIVK